MARAARTAFTIATRASCPLLRCVIGGVQPLLLGSNVRDDNSVLTVELANPD